MNKRIIIGIALSLIMIVVIIFAIANKDTLFTNEVVIEYPDGCVEKYVMNKLVTEKCEDKNWTEYNKYDDSDGFNFNLTLQ